MTRPTDALIKKINRILDEERTCLLSGNLEKLSSISEEKSDLIGQIDQNWQTPANADVRRVLEKAERNAQLLAHARDGLRTALSRLAEIRTIQNGLETYGPRGDRLRLKAEKANRLERRA